MKKSGVVKLVDKRREHFYVKRLEKEDALPLALFFKLLSPRSIKKFHPHPFTRQFAQNVCKSSGGQDLKLGLFDNKNMQIVGYAFVNKVFLLGSKGYLGIAILDSFQGRGLGRKFMKSLFEFSRQESIREIYLNVYEDNDIAVGLYRNLGFQRIPSSNQIIYYLIIFKELLFARGFWGLVSLFVKPLRKRSARHISIWMKKNLGK